MNYLFSLGPDISKGSNVWTTILACVLLAIGLIIIIKGGDFFVDASVWIAEVLKMPKFLIGATIVSMATTLPELLVSVFAVIGGNNAIAVGNAVGSVTANTGFILALSAIFIGATINRKDFGIKSFLIVLAGIILIVFCSNGSLGILPSILLLVVFVYYIINIILSSKKAAEESKEKTVEQEPDKSKKAIIKNIALFIGGAIGIVLGARLLVDNATFVAKAIGVSDSIIAITIVAIGTSLPELITTITAIVKKHGDLSVGNIIGANIIDIVLILPICSFISGGNLIINNQARILDLPALLIISLVAIIPPLVTKKFHKWQGILMLILYITYIALAAIFFSA